ncbi:transcription factor bHLH129 isoform X2 [Henckelia pumila]|uniref:transcription factor bHLH129 isoform X2 n=1 Tax=Henckelia pumila TaxID=405737 RepID=UPI003C6EA03C
MYSSSTSSSSQGSMGLVSSGTAGGGGLLRYGSAPSSLLAASVDSAREFSGHSHLSAVGHREEPPPPSKANATIGLQRAYGFGVSGASSSSLVRHSSSPAGFLNQIAAAVGDSGGFSVTRGMGNYNNSENLSRLNSQLSFTRQDSTLSYISEENESADGDEMRTQNGQRKTSHPYGFGMGTSSSTWDETNSVMFSMAPNKRSKIVGSGGDFLGSLDSMENQFQFSMGQGGMEMTQMEKLMHSIPQDSVPCKIRAKRGCATHPRSIAERERRTRISGKLKKLQVLVPNMDKQTSYADMLDLAVQHIKSLQNQVQD